MELRMVQKCISDLTCVERYLESTPVEQQRLSDMLLEITRTSFAITSLAGVDTNQTKLVESTVGILEENGEEARLDHGLQRTRINGEFVAHVLKRLTSDRSKALVFYKWASKQPGFRHTSLTLNQLLKSYANAGHVKGALDLLASELKSVTDFSSFELLTPRLTKGYQMVEVLALMYKTGFPLDLGICKQALKAFLDEGSKDKCSILAVCSLVELCEQRAAGDDHAWELLLKAAAKGRLERAGDLSADLKEAKKNDRSSEVSLLRNTSLSSGLNPLANEFKPHH